MTRSRFRKAAASFTSLALALVGLTFFPSRMMAQQETTSGVTLRPGLVIHPSLNVAYVMTPEGVAAVDIGTGAKRWATSDAAKPLALAGNLLISQAEPRIGGNRLELVALNTQERGATSVRGVTELPTGVRVSIGETLEGTFKIEARPAAANVTVIWNFERVPRQGMDVSTDEERPATGQRLSLMPTTGGTLQMSLTTGAVRQMDNTMLRIKPPPQLRYTSNTLASGADSAQAAQFESADGHHVLTSERVGDDKVWDKYRWTVSERGSGRRVGQLRTHLSFAPFVVRNSVLVYETTPYVRRGEAEEPAKLRGVNLSTGQEVWGVEVREIVYRGPFPP